VRRRADLLRTIERWSPDQFAARLTAADAPLVLDVRNAGEWNQAHIHGSLLIPLVHLEDHLRDLPRDRKIAIHCASGYRSSIAASLIARSGLTDLADLVGGIQAWQSAGKPTES